MEKVDLSALVLSAINHEFNRQGPNTVNFARYGVNLCACRNSKGLSVWLTDGKVLKKKLIGDEHTSLYACKEFIRAYIVELLTEERKEKNDDTI